MQRHRYAQQPSGEHAVRNYISPPAFTGGHAVRRHPRPQPSWANVRSDVSYVHSLRRRTAARSLTCPQPSGADVQQEVSHAHSLTGQVCNNQMAIEKTQYRSSIRRGGRASPEASLYSVAPTLSPGSEEQEREAHIRRVSSIQLHAESSFFRRVEVRL